MADVSYLIIRFIRMRIVIFGTLFGFHVFLIQLLGGQMLTNVRVFSKEDEITHKVFLLKMYNKDNDIPFLIMRRLRTPINSFVIRFQRMNYYNANTN